MALLPCEKDNRMDEIAVKTADPPARKVRGDMTDPAAAAAVPDAKRMGRLARTPAQIPWSGWKRVLHRTAREMATDRISLVAAGCAFYATLALFPAITMLVSIYGLVFDPATVGPQMAVLRDLLPPSAYQLIADRVQVLVSKPPSTLTFSLGLSIVIALWSATTGTKSILGALNLAYEERETRSFVRFQLTAIGMTLGGILAAVIGLAALLLLPAAVALLHISAYGALIARSASFALLVLFVLLALSLLYRFGPSRRSAGWHWVTPGSLCATLLWLLASVLFSFYVQHLASYDATYGPLGAVVGVMMWFYVSALAVMVGAELNAELELQTVHDSTEAPEKPIGERGAYVADHVAR
jgi:membrane protein